MVRSARLALGAVLLLGALPVMAASGPEPGDVKGGDRPESQDSRSAAPSLDQLYGRLQAVGSDDEAQGIVGAIERTRLRSGSDTADLLMTRALSATQGNDLPLAIKLLSAVIQIRPAFTEAWNKRATLYFMRDDYTRAMMDIAETLKRDPRHFGAWSGLGMILQETGDKHRAYDAYKRALAIDPHLDAARKAVEDLRQDVEGRDI